MIYSHLFILLLCFLGVVQAGAFPPPIRGFKKNKLNHSRNSTISNKSSGNSMVKKSRTLDIRSLFGRQEECPPDYPQLCPDMGCCEAEAICCDDGTCCGVDSPVCQPDICCPSGEITCGTVSPGHCHTSDTICCEGEDATCPESGICCGDGCCEGVDDNGDPLKCCAGTEDSVCCGEYDVCCDGYCCGEGATCVGDGECAPATLIWNDVKDGLELCENTCLGIRSQITKPGVYDIDIQYQLLTYAGVGSSGDAREDGPCAGGSCCSGVGSTYQCDEYPYASTYQGGEGAWAACVDQPQNSRQGGVLKNFLASKHNGFQFYVVVDGIDCDSVAANALLPLNPQCLPQVSLPY